ncbi:MAG TPA: 50S ribosomal protein L15 [bacterium]|nr:50S ribosomal protein L15 [bacterium]
MKINQLKPPPGSRHKEKRLGRGDASGHGGTSTRGHKGHKSRTGFSLSFNFEGGQMPLSRRLPKHGFRHAKTTRWVALNLKKVVALFGGSRSIKIENFCQRGLLKAGEYLKILGSGSLRQPLEIEAHAFSALARARIEQAGGKAVVVEKPVSPREEKEEQP